MRVAWGIVACFLAVAFASNALAQIGKPEKIAADKAPSILKQLTAAQAVDLSQVFVARIFIDGTRRDFTSLQPEILGKYDDDGKIAVSVGRIEKTTAELILFTLDPGSGAGARLVIPLAALKKKPQFTFPIVKSDGTVAQAKFEVFDYHHLP